MSTAKVERRHREAALIALFGGVAAPSMGGKWRQWAIFGTGDEAGERSLHCTPAMLAEAIAAAEQRTREECVAMVRAEALVQADFADELEALAERMLKGGG